MVPDTGAECGRYPSPVLVGIPMSSARRVPILIVALGTALAVGPVRAEDRPSAPPETQAPGNWTDPPARTAPAPTHAAAPRPVPTPAKIDEAAATTAAERRAKRGSVARSAKLKRQAIRQAASRARIERRVRIAKPTPPATAVRVSSRMATPPRPARGRVHGGRPAYGFIEPDAPAAAYYAQRRFGAAGNGPASLGLTPGYQPPYRLVRMQAEVRPVMVWRGAVPPFGSAVGEPFSPDAFEDE